MQSLFSLLARYGIFLLFLFLEGLCFVFAVQFNEKQQLIWLTSANRVTGSLQEKMDEVQDFFYLTEVADSLTRDNARLNEELLKYKQVDTLGIDTVQLKRDSTEQLYAFYAAKVVKNSIHHPNNYLTLNRGSEDGIEKDMGVITEKGVIGIVIGVTKNYSLVMSLLHNQSRISAAVKRNDYFGSLVWDGQRPTHMRLENIPKHANIQKNDTIVTSGYSTIFPPQIMIGTVDTFSIAEGSNFYDIDVRLKEDLSKVEYVYLVKHLRNDQLKELEQQENYE